MTKLGDLTLRELLNICISQPNAKSCKECPLFKIDCDRFIASGEDTEMLDMEIKIDKKE